MLIEQCSHFHQSPKATPAATATATAPPAAAPRDALFAVVEGAAVFEDALVLKRDQNRLPHMTISGDDDTYEDLVAVDCEALAVLCDERVAEVSPVDCPDVTAVWSVAAVPTKALLLKALVVPPSRAQTRPFIRCCWNVGSCHVELRWPRDV